MRRLLLLIGTLVVATGLGCGSASTATTTELDCGVGTHQENGACVADSPTSSGVDGNWSVTAHVTSCSNVTGTNTIAVSGGQFTNSKIFSYNDASGVTETVTITGTLTAGSSSVSVSGNEFLTGNDCAGGNGFSGSLTTTGTSTTGTVASFWGTLQFTKQ